MVMRTAQIFPFSSRHMTSKKQKGNWLEIADQIDVMLDLE